MGSWGVRGALPPVLGQGVQGGVRGAEPPGLQVHDVQGGSGERSLPVYKCTAYKGGPGACPRFGRLG